jgi:hypothetical protein
MQCSAHQNPNIILAQIEKSILKFIWKHKRTRFAKSNPEQEEQFRRYQNAGFKLFYRTIEIKAAWDWHKDRHDKQWNRI